MLHLDVIEVADPAFINAWSADEPEKSSRRVVELLLEDAEHSTSIGRPWRGKVYISSVQPYEPGHVRLNCYVQLDCDSFAEARADLYTRDEDGRVVLEFGWIDIGEPMRKQPTEAVVAADLTPLL